mgnify:CR=1 FL=1
MPRPALRLRSSPKKPRTRPPCGRILRVGLVPEDLIKLLEKQDGKCALSGVTLTCQLEKGNIAITNASIDRIEAGGPYIIENIQLVCKSINAFRLDKSTDEFIWWCKQVAEWNK